MNQVPFRRQIIFADWHGVTRPVLGSIRSSASHPLHRQLEAGAARVFVSGRDTANEWMSTCLRTW